MLKRTTQKREKGGTFGADRFSLGKTFLALLLTLSMSTMGYSPAIAETVAQDNAASADTQKPASETATEPETTTPDQGETTQPTESASSDEAQTQPETTQTTPTTSTTEGTTTSDQQEQTAQQPQEQKEAPVIQTTVKTADGLYYTVKMTADEQAGIPDNAQLSVVEVNKELTQKQKEDPANRDRPLKTERFISESDYAERAAVVANGLDANAEDDDYVFFTKLLDVEVTVDGAVVQPTKPVEVTVETDAVAVQSSDAIEAAMLTDDKQLAGNQQALRDHRMTSDGKSPTELDVTNLTDEEDAKTHKVPADEKYVKLQITMDEFGELALAGVVEPKVDVSHSDADTILVLGPRSMNVHAHDVNAAGVEDGQELVGAYGFSVSPDRSYDTTLWVSSKVHQAAANANDAQPLAGYLVSGGTVSDELFGKTGTKEPASFTNDDGLALVAASPAEAATDESKASDIVQPYVTMVNNLRANLKALTLMALTPQADGDGKSGTGEGDEPKKTYTVTWVNYDNTPLETDKNVEEGTMPSYDGATPTKPSSASEDFEFAGWTPELAPVTSNVTYKATFAKIAFKVVVSNKGRTEPISGAAFTLTNITGGQNVRLWQRTSGNDGKLYVKLVDSESQDCGGVALTPGNVYKLEQTATDTPYVCPKGYWTITVSSDSSASGDKRFTVATVCDAGDITTVDSISGPINGQFFVENQGAAFLTYKYNYPEGASGQPDDYVVRIEELDYNVQHPIDLEDPTLDGYQFAGWLDKNNVAYKYDDTVKLVTALDRAPVLTASWRVPLKLKAVTYEGSDWSSPTDVAGSAGAFEVATEDDARYTVDQLGTAYASQNTAVQTLESQKGLAFATITTSSGSSARLAEMRYQQSTHAWQYRTEGSASDAWTNLALTDEVTLYYHPNRLNVKWVKDDGSGNLTEISGAPTDKTYAVSKASWDNADSMFAQLEMSRAESLIEGRSFFQYYGFGKNATTTSGLSNTGTDFQLKSADDGFRYREGSSGDGTLMQDVDTIYLVYADTPPEDSTRLDIQNSTNSVYDVASIKADGSDAIAILVPSSGNFALFDGGTGTKHAAKQVGANDSAHLVLLNAAGRDFVVNGGFSTTPGTVTASVLNADADNNTVTHTVLSDSDISDTGKVTKGTLSSQQGRVVVDFSATTQTFTVNKAWSDDAYPEQLVAELEFYEVWQGDAASAPPAVSFADQSGAEGKAAELRGQGYIVVKCQNPDPATANGLISIVYKEGAAWAFDVVNLPSKNKYYAVETAVKRTVSKTETKDETSYFTRTYNVNNTEETVTNTRSGAICRVGDQTFASIIDAVTYITGHDETLHKVATIEMLGDTIIPASKAVTIPTGYAITITTATELSANASISRGFDGGSLFNVQGTLSVKNVVFDSKVGSTQYKATDEGAGGFVTVASGGNFIAQNTTFQNGYAVKGSAVYVADSGGAAFADSSITGGITSSRDGGAVNVGGTGSRINLSGNVVVSSNYAQDDRSRQRNIYLDQDSSEIINVVGTGLGGNANVGVFVADGATLYNTHGKPSKPFATYESGAASSNLNAFVNDRITGGPDANTSRLGYASTVLDNTVVWGETFDLTVNVHWYDQDFRDTTAPSEGTVGLTLHGSSGGTTTEADTNVNAQFTGAGWTYTFKGLAKLNTSGDQCVYWVTETDDDLKNLGEGFRQKVFTSDIGTTQDRPTNYDACSGGADPVTLNNYLRYSTFSVTKKAASLPDGATLTTQFNVYRVSKAGIDEYRDVAPALRTFVASTVQPFAYSTQDGTNEGAWGAETLPSLLQGKYPDVVVEKVGGTYTVQSGSTWTSSDVANLKLDSDYYYYAVETNVRENGGDGRSLSGIDLRSAYDIHYSYAYDFDTCKDAVTITNTYRPALAVEKKWVADETEITGGEVPNKTTSYEMRRVTLADFESIVGSKKSQAGGVTTYPISYDDMNAIVAKSELMSGWDFSLPQVNAGDDTGSRVKTVATSKLAADYVYFAKETAINGKDVAPGTVRYVYEEKPGGAKVLTVKNDNDYICKIVDSTGTHPFRTLNAALNYGRTRTSDSQTEFTIEMLLDYTVPSVDVMTINAGENITLTTASTEGDSYPYQGSGTKAILTRGAGNNLSFITVNGAAENPSGITLKNIAFSDPSKTTVVNSRQAQGLDRYYSNSGGFINAMHATVTLGVGTPGDNDDSETSGLTNGSGVEMTGGKGTNGGAIFAYQCVVNVNQAKFTECESTTTAGDQYGGGAIFASDAIWDGASTEIKITHSEFQKCTTQSNGGGLITTALKPQLQYNIFKECEANRSGGGVFHNNRDADSELTLTTGVFDACKTTGNHNEQGGGGVASFARVVNLSGTVQFTNCESVRSGGGIYHNSRDPESRTTIQGLTFTDCKSTQTGQDKQSTGAVLTKARALSMTDCNFYRCTSGRQGGAVFHWQYDEGSTCTATNCHFEECHANGDSVSAGALESDAWEITLTECSFKQCTSTKNGGALSLWCANLENGDYATSVTIESCSFEACVVNNTGDTFGGALRSTAKKTTILNSTFGNPVAADPTAAACHAPAGGAVALANSTEGSSCSILGCTFASCYAHGGSGSKSKAGGALFVKSRSLVIDLYPESATAGDNPARRTVFDNCKSNSASGGAVYGSADVRTVTVKATDFTNCSANNHGGGLYMEVGANVADTSLTVDDVSFKNCKAANDGGGGIYTRVVSMSVANSVFEKCASKAAGGGIYNNNGNSGSTCVVDNCKFTTCESTNSGGGAICVDSQKFDLKNSSISDCTVRTGGGGVHQNYSNTDSYAHLENVRFNNCTATNEGGGALRAQARELSMTDCTFTTVEAKTYGGAVHHTNNNADASISAQNCKFTDCNALSSDGGGVRSGARTATFQHCDATRCTSLGSGGFIYSDAFYFTATDVHVSQASARNSGGAIYQTKGDAGTTFTVENSTFDNCSVMNNAGGAIRAQARAFVLTDVAMTNTSSNEQGGAAYHDNNSGDAYAQVVRCTFNTCSTKNGNGSGGGMQTNSPVLTFQNNTLNNCTARTWGGGFNHNNGNATQTLVEDCTFTNCTATLNEGGGVRANGKNVEITRTTFTNCTADTTNGGGVSHGNDNGTLSIRGSFFNDCAAKADGGGVYCAVATLNMEACQIDGCVEDAANPGKTITNANYGGGIYNRKATATLKNVQIRNCSAAYDGGGYYRHSDNGGRDTTVDSCSITGNSAGHQGGGIYFWPNAKLVLKNGTSVTGNLLTTTTVGDGAGIYLVQNNNNPSQSPTLVIGGDLETDTITVFDNKTSNGSQSNVRLVTKNVGKAVYNRENSVSLLSNLSKPGIGIAGSIGVCNPGPPTTQFGVANEAYRTGVEYFVSDFSSMHGSLSVSDTTGTKIYWFSPPICKITDSNDAILNYYDGATWKNALFYSLNDAIDAVNTGSFVTPGGVEAQPAKIQMLVDLVPVESNTPTIRKNVTITTADVGDNELSYPANARWPQCVIMRGPDETTSMLSVDRGVSLTVSKLVLDGGSAESTPLTCTTRGGLISMANSSTVTLDINTTLRNSDVGNNDGGAIYVPGGATLNMQLGAIVQNCSAKNGGGIYADAGAVVNLRDSQIVGCDADANGGAVYVGDYARVTMANTPEIRSNTCAGKGAGIYLYSTNSKLEMQYRSIFSNNTVTGADFSGKTNGGEPYNAPRQDIYLATFANPANSIVVTGNLAVPEGSIWVWPEASNHYKMDQQFATIANGVTVSEDTYSAFRDARDDATAENITGQYYTGVTGANASYIYWGNGADVFFKKVDGYGAALGNAGFTLYRDFGCTNPVTVRVNGVAVPEVFSDGAFDAATGTNVAFRATNGVYYMKETTTPLGRQTNDNVYRVIVGKGQLARWGVDAGGADFAIQRVSSATVADPVPVIATYGVLNIATASQKTIFKKVDDAYVPLAGAKFDILRYDRTVVDSPDASGEGGAFWIGDLPYGTYYLHETTTPASVAQSTTGWWYTVTVDESGVDVSMQSAMEPAA